jgi:hypothetical protein
METPGGGRSFAPFFLLISLKNSQLSGQLQNPEAELPELAISGGDLSGEAESDLSGIAQRSRKTEAFGARRLYSTLIA